MSSLTAHPPPPPPPPRPNPPNTRHPPPQSSITHSSTHPLPPPQHQQNANQQQQQQQQQRQSRFNFQIDKRAPQELHHLEEETIRKRMEYKQRVHELNVKLASIQTKLNVEKMDRDIVYSEMQEQFLTRPLEQAVERICGKMEDFASLPFMEPAALPSSSPRSSPLSKMKKKSLDGASTTEEKEEDSSEKETDKGNKESNEKDINNAKGRATRIERKVHSLSASLHQLAHSITYDTRTAHLDPIKYKIQNDIQPLVSMESSKSHKVEGGIVRKFESSISEVDTGLTKECVTRSATIDILKEEVDKVANFDVRREEDFLKAIRDIRELLRLEREERMRRDEEVVEKIVVTKKALQTIMLESLGSSGGFGGLGSE